MHPPNSRIGLGTISSNIRKLRNLGKFRNFVEENKYSCYNVLKLIGGGNPPFLSTVEDKSNME